MTSSKSLPLYASLQTNLLQYASLITSLVQMFVWISTWLFSEEVVLLEFTAQVRPEEIRNQAVDLCQCGKFILLKVSSLFRQRGPAVRGRKRIIQQLLDFACYTALVCFLFVNQCYERARSHRRRVFLEKLANHIIQPNINRKHQCLDLPMKADIIDFQIQRNVIQSSPVIMKCHLPEKIYEITDFRNKREEILVIKCPGSIANFFTLNVLFFAIC